jgi:hypothetical protein
MDSLFAQPYISPPDYDTVEFPSKKEILLVQQSAVNEYDSCQQNNATARQGAPPQQFNAGGMRMVNNALWIPERGVELQLRLCVEAHCRSAVHRAYEAALGAIKEYVEWTTMSRSLCRIVCTVSLLFLEAKFHFRWVRSYMQPIPMRSCISISFTLGCQEMGSNSLDTSQG